MKPSIELHIEELVLHGFSPKDRYRIAEAIESELVRLFAEGSIPPALLADGEIEHVNGGVFELQAGARPDAIGAHVAQAVYKGLMMRTQPDKQVPANRNAAKGTADSARPVSRDGGSRL